MASPHSPYAHPGPPPYYHPPQPQLPYSNGHSPSPYLQYQLPPMNGHAPMHQPASPRMNGAGRGRFNSSHRGVPNYSHYQPMPSPHNQPMPPPHTLHPPPMHSPTISSEIPYTHPQKYPQQTSHVHYSPPYPPPNGPYPPAWSAQTLSPLPKQLSMPPPVFPSPQQPSVQEIQAAHEDQAVPEARIAQDPAPSSLDITKTDQNVAAPPPHSPSPPRQPESTQVAVEAEAEVLPLLQSEALKSSNATSEPLSWVIWSRRPQDPSRAPGIIISSRAHPPEHIRREALDLPSPPVSPQLRSLKIPLQQLAPVGDDASAPHEELGSPEVAHVPSSSATETTPASLTPADTPMPGSPVSSLTSVSITGSSPAGAEKTLTPAEPASKAEPVPPVYEAAPAPTAETVATTAPSAAATAPPASPPAATPSKPAAPKKSWASLLQSSDNASSSSKSRLPVSSVVGFSIPAASASSVSAGTPVAPARRNDLLNVLNAVPSSSSLPLKIAPRGLVNTGNMCFANAVLQVLVYCPPFHKLVVDLGRFLAGPVVGSQKEGTKATPLLDAMIQFMREFAPPAAGAGGKGKERQEDDFYEPESFIPAYVYDAMKEKKSFASMITGHQEDAEEFLGFFLDTLEEELLSLSTSLSSRAKPAEDHAGPQDDGWYEVGKRNKVVATRTVKSTDSPITRIFGGKFRSTLQAPYQRESVVVEDWRSLRLDIQREQVHTIKDAIHQISHPQSVQISSPTRPGVVIEANQQALVESLPPVLILHLKRFHYDTNVGDVVKIGKQIVFGPELEIGPDLIAPTRRTTHPIKYQLFGVLYHHGQSAHGGHYTLDVLHPNRDLSDRPRHAWIRIDDELVSDVRPEDVFGGQDRDDKCAYLLFYRRVGGWGPVRT